MSESIDRRALVETSGATLDGKPARITGYRNEFATVATRDGMRVEFAWSTVARIVANGAAFRS